MKAPLTTQQQRQNNNYEMFENNKDRPNVERKWQVK